MASVKKVIEVPRTLYSVALLYEGCGARVILSYLLHVGGAEPLLDYEILARAERLAAADLAKDEWREKGIDAARMARAMWTASCMVMR